MSQSRARSWRRIDDALVTWVTWQEALVPEDSGRARAARDGSATRHVLAGGRRSAARVVAAQRGLRRAARSGRTRSSPAPTTCGSLFFQCGNEVLADLHRTLANEPVSLMLTDADGRGARPAERRPSLLRGARRRAPRAGFRLLRAGRRAPTGSGWRSPTGCPTLVRADQHYALSLCTLHVRRGSGARSRDRAGSRAASTSRRGRGRRATCCWRWPGRRRATPRR